MEWYIGMDVHSKACVYAVQDKEEVLIGEGRVETSYEGMECFRDRHRLAAITRTTSRAEGGPGRGSVLSSTVRRNPKFESTYSQYRDRWAFRRESRQCRRLVQFASCFTRYPRDCANATFVWPLACGLTDPLLVDVSPPPLHRKSAPASGLPVGVLHRRLTIVNSCRM